MTYGKTCWLIPDCYWPEVTTPGVYVSHEAICLLNTGARDAHVRFTFYYEDEPPRAGYAAVCKALRTFHVRLDQLTNELGAHLPRGKAYAALVESDEPIVVQYSRLDTSRGNEALMTTLAYPV